MRNLKVKSVTVADRTLFGEAFARGANLASNRPQASINHDSIDIESMRLIDALTPQGAGVNMHRIEIELDDAFPESNYVNFMIGEQLIVGTMFDEESQVLSGYVPVKPKSTDELRIEYPSGEEENLGAF